MNIRVLYKQSQRSSKGIMYNFNECDDFPDSDNQAVAPGLNPDDSDPGAEPLPLPHDVRVTPALDYIDFVMARMGSFKLLDKAEEYNLASELASASHGIALLTIARDQSARELLSLIDGATTNPRFRRT